MTSAAASSAATTRDHGGGQKTCTRNEQRTDTTRFQTHQCIETRDDRVRADLRLKVRAELSTPAAARDATVRVRDRARRGAHG